MVFGILFLHHPPYLNKCCDAEYTPYYPIKDMLVITDLISNNLSSENKKKIADKSADTDTDDIKIIMIISW